MVAQIDRSFIQARPGKVWPRLLAYALFEGRPLTTRGRWINPLVLAGHRLWPMLPIRAAPLDPVFILGLGRSGTTVLGTILALHRDVGYLNEPKALWHAALGNDDLIGSYSRVPGRYRMTARDATAGRCRRLRRSYAAYLGLAGCRRVVDKYPELLFRTELIDAVFPRARKLMLIRNGLDTLQSIDAWSRRHGQTGARPVDWWGRNRRKWHLLVDELIAPDAFFADALPAIRTLSRQTDMAAIEWIATMREARRLRKRDDDVLFIRYEDLTAHPRPVMREILAHCALPDDEKMLRYAEKVLRPRPPHGAVRLHPRIAPLFRETMSTLGYDCENLE